MERGEGEERKQSVKRLFHRSINTGETKKKNENENREALPSPPPPNNAVETAAAEVAVATAAEESEETGGATEEGRGGPLLPEEQRRREVGRSGALLFSFFRLLFPSLRTAFCSPIAQIYIQTNKLTVIVKTIPAPSANGHAAEG